jgi:hypothetical protein
MPVVTLTQRAATESFESLLARAANRRSSRPHSLDHGVDEQALVRYSDGAVSVGERQIIQAVLSQCSWAHKFVIGRVKRRRPQGKRSAA